MVLVVQVLPQLVEEKGGEEMAGRLAQLWLRTPRRVSVLL